MLAFQGLHARKLVRARDPLAPRRQRPSLLVECTDIGDFGIEVLIAFIGRGEPVVDQMRL